MGKEKHQPDLIGGKDVVYYDSACGLCHALVRRIIKLDTDGKRFVFASLQGPFIKGELSESVRNRLPDSIVVQRAAHHGKNEKISEAPLALLVESDAVLYIGWQLGGWRRVAAKLGYWLPRGGRNFLYRRVARVRRRLAAPPTGACPATDPKVMQRFVD